MTIGSGASIPASTVRLDSSLVRKNRTARDESPARSVICVPGARFLTRHHFESWTCSSAWALVALAAVGTPASSGDPDA
jgi:hypothetical protein